MEVVLLQIVKSAERNLIIILYEMCIIRSKEEIHITAYHVYNNRYLNYTVFFMFILKTMAKI